MSLRQRPLTLGTQAVKGMGACMRLPLMWPRRWLIQALAISLSTRVAANAWSLPTRVRKLRR